MASISPEQKSELIRLVVSLYGQAPSAATVGLLEAQLAAGKSTAQLAHLLGGPANALTGADTSLLDLNQAFASLYPASQASNNYISQFLATFGLQNDPGARAVIGQLLTQPDVNKGDIALLAEQFLSSTTEPGYLAARQTLYNKSSIAAYYANVSDVVYGLDPQYAPALAPVLGGITAALAVGYADAQAQIENILQAARPAQESDLLGLAVLMFKASAGAFYLSHLQSLVPQIGGTKALASALDDNPAYRAINPDDQSAAQYADSLLGTVGLEGNALAHGIVVSQIQAGFSKGEMAYALLRFLTDGSDATFNQTIAGLNTSDQTALSAARRELMNKIDVATYHSITQVVGTTDFITLQNVIASVTDEPDSVQAAIHAIDEALNGRPIVELAAIAAGIGGFVIHGQAAGDSSGLSVASAGDVNGDGLADLIIGAYASSPAAGFSAGRSYVVFGKSDGAEVNLSAIAAGTGGFVINGEAAVDSSGFSVAGAGDVNGDGLADLIVGAPGSDPGGLYIAGRSYVVFGKGTTSEVNLSAVAAGNGGFVINGEAANDFSGLPVASEGDVNGDGLADLIVGAYSSDPASGVDAGRSYVVFGKSGTGEVNLSAVAAGNGGFVINGQAAGDNSGYSVASAGDVNGDGLADLIIGAFHPDLFGTLGSGANLTDGTVGSAAGRSYVVFGKTDATEVNLSAVANGIGGFVIHSQGAGGPSGNSVASAGDVNGDGLADLIIGASLSDPAAGIDAGRSYVVFGKSDTSAVNLSAVAAAIGGFVINGQTANERSGNSVASAGDVNGDGLTDLIVGAPQGMGPSFTTGRSYVVFGKQDTAEVNLSAVAAGIGGFIIHGQAFGDGQGSSVSGAGDVNGDGLADLIVGSPGSDPAAGRGAGRSYVIFGSTTGAFNQTAFEHIGSTDNDTLTGTAGADHFAGGDGDDSFIANGGTDVLYGGRGDDVFQLTASNVAKLNVAGARIDGGTGIDTVKLDGTSIVLDLSQVGGGKLTGIERFDLAGSGNNTLKLQLRDVLDLGGVNRFNAATGWDGLPDSVARHQLVVDGDSGDTVQLGSGWSHTGSTSFHGVSYAIYHHANSAAEVLIVGGISVTTDVPALGAL